MEWKEARRLGGDGRRLEGTCYSASRSRVSLSGSVTKNRVGAKKNDDRIEPSFGARDRSLSTGFLYETGNLHRSIEREARRCSRWMRINPVWSARHFRHVDACMGSFRTVNSCGRRRKWALRLGGRRRRRSRSPGPRAIPFIATFDDSTSRRRAEGKPRPRHRSRLNFFAFSGPSSREGSDGVSKN